MEAMCSSRRADPLLPPGFRFHPTDEELIDYLIKKVNNNSFCIRAIGDVDLNKNEPWDLPEKAKMGEKEWYFFTLRDRKYPTGMRTNRATEAGYWKATGKDRDIIRTGTQSFVGAKKTLVFYRGRAPKGTKTNWIMHEYRLEGEAAYLHNSRNSKDSEWVVCRIFQKSPGGKKGYKETHREHKNECEYSDHSSLPPLLDSPHPDSSATADSGISFPMLKHIPAEFGSIRFPWSYEQPLYDVENIPTTSRNIRASCKMEPTYNLDQQHQQQQNIYNYDVSSKRESNWLNDAYSLANPLQDQGLTEILGLPGSNSAVDLESLWTY